MENANEGEILIEKSKKLLAEYKKIPIWKIFTLLKKKNELDENIRKTDDFIKTFWQP